MFERFTDRARRTIFFARYEASQSGSETIQPGHLLLALLREERQLATGIRNEDIDDFRATLTPPRPKKISVSVDLPLSMTCRRILAFGAEEAEHLKQSNITPAHLALGILREDDDTAAHFLKTHGATVDQLRQYVAEPVADSGAARPPMDGMEWLKRIMGRLGQSTFQHSGDSKEGRFSATRVENGVRTVESHNFIQGREVHATETMQITDDGKTLRYTIEVRGPGQHHRQEIDFPLEP